MLPQTKVFVGSLPPGSRPEELRKLFERFGVVTECDIMNRCGFVHMETEEQANAAISALNNTTFNGASLCVERGRVKERGARGGGGGRGRGMRGGMRGGMDRRGGGPMRGGAPYMRDVPYSRDRGMHRGHLGGAQGPMGRNPMPYERERVPPSAYDDRYNGYGGDDRRGYPPMDRGARDPYAAPSYGAGRYDEVAPLYDDRRAPMYDNMMDQRSAVTPYERPMLARAAPLPNGDMYNRSSMHTSAPGAYDRADPYAQQYPAMGRGGGGAARDREMAGMGPRRY